MTETSWFWGGTSPGDATSAPYDDDEFSDVLRKLLQENRTSQGVIEDYANGLAVSNPAGNTIRIATGAALVDGKFYENDANKDPVILTPGVSTRIDRVVLRKSWGNQTVRIVILTGVEGGGVPALTQTDGGTWEIPLAQVSITVVPVIVVTDERTFARTPLSPSSASAMEEIETIVAPGGAATIDFTAIPSTYQHLVIIGSGAMDGAILEADLEARFNNDSGANYNEQSAGGESGAAVAAAQVAQNEIFLGQIKCASGVANHASDLNANVANYKDTTFYKSILAESGHIPNNTVADFAVKMAGGLWLSTAAINRITLLSTTGGAGDFVAGSTYTLYGLNAS